MRWVHYTNGFKRLQSMVAAVLLIAVVFLCTTAQAQGTAISQGFEAKEDIPVGSLITLQKASKNRIQLATNERASDLIGIAADKSLVEISSAKKMIQVVTSGVTVALVSDINGDVKNGDKITASPIAGVGMKSYGGSQIVGIAEADLSTVKTVSREVKERDGTVETVRIGRMPVQVNVSYYMEEDNNSFIPSFLQQLANSIAGKEVGVARVVIALLVMLFSIVGVGVMLYASVRSSIISIGRNPLSEVAVRKSLFGVASVAIIILLVMLSAVYLIITV